MGEKPVVAFLGPKASYTHQVSRQSSHDLSFPAENATHSNASRELSRQAAISEFPESDYEIRPQTSIEDVFAAVQSGTAAHGVVPFENSSNGSVVFTLDLFADLNNRYPDILVEGEIYLAVQHCLLGHIARPNSQHRNSDPRRMEMPWRRLKEEDSPNVSGAVTPTQDSPSPVKPKVKPHYNIGHVKKLYSHPQAWGQCKVFLNTFLKGVERQDVSSTSKAAELVAQDTSGTSAAISSRIAASMNDLDILAEGIEDNEGNSTRFFILRRQDSPPLRTPPSILIWDTAAEMQDYKTLVSFTVSHEAPGALADSLAVFKKYGLNLTSINTRPSGETAWHYIFFVEFKGRKRGDGEGGAVNDALRELGAAAQSWRWLGSWENKLKG